MVDLDDSPLANTHFSTLFLQNYYFFVNQTHKNRKKCKYTLKIGKKKREKSNFTHNFIQHLH